MPEESRGSVRRVKGEWQEGQGGVTEESRGRDRRVGERKERRGSARRVKEYGME